MFSSDVLVGVAVVVAYCSLLLFTLCHILAGSPLNVYPRHEQYVQFHRIVIKMYINYQR